MQKTFVLAFGIASIAIGLAEPALAKTLKCVTFENYRPSNRDTAEIGVSKLGAPLKQCFWIYSDDPPKRVTSPGTAAGYNNGGTPSRPATAYKNK